MLVVGRRPPSRRRAAALVVLVAFSSPAALPAAWPPADDASPEVVVESLQRELRSIAVRDADPQRRAWAWRTLDRSDPAVIASLAPTGLADPDAVVRRETARALGALVDLEIPEARAARLSIAAALADPAPTVRRAAARAIDDSAGETDWREIGAAAGLADESEWVRETCFDRLRGEDEELSDELHRGLLDAIVRGSPAVRRWAVARTPERPPTGHDHAAAVAIALASDDFRVRMWGRAAGAANPRDAVERFLSDPDPIVREAAFGFGMPRRGERQEATRSVLERGLLDESAAVARDALTWAEESKVALAADEKRLRELALHAPAERAELAAETLWAIETRGLSPGDVLRRGRARIAELRRAAVGSEERRLAARQIPALLRRSLHAFGDLHDLDGRAIELGSYGDSILDSVSLCGSEAARVLAEDLFRSIRRELSDPDAVVRRAALQTLAIAWSWSDHERGDRVRQTLDAWRAITGLSGDPDPSVRRAVIVAVGGFRFASRSSDHTGLVYRTDDSPEIAALYDAAAEAALADSDPEIARFGALSCRQSWRPAATPHLLRAIAEPPRDSRRRLENDDARRCLLQNAPEALGVETLLSWACVDDDAAIDALLRLDALDRLLAVADALDPARREALGDILVRRSRFESGDGDDGAEVVVSTPRRGDETPLDEADRADLVAFLDRWTGDPDDFAAELIAREPRIAVGEGEDVWGRLANWAAEPKRTPGVRRAVFELRFAVDPEAAVAFAGTEDPFFAALALDALAAAVKSGVFDSAQWKSDSPRGRAVLEAARRRGRPPVDPTEL